ncbi:MAG TPA: S-adenosylmethionine decarboxylase [Bryobacteraceae bacterium]|nr:S-adenosylmethionine decarboxylase [Bryobacteraceae bacterium]
MSGLEWIVEAHGCDPVALTSTRRLADLFQALIAALDLHPLDKSNWHQFPGTGGITGVTLLTESHLACHTFPEYGSMCLNIFCCRPRPGMDFEALLKQALGAERVSVRQVERPYQT